MLLHAYIYIYSRQRGTFDIGYIIQSVWAYVTYYVDCHSHFMISFTTFTYVHQFEQELPEEVRSER